LLFGIVSRTLRRCGAESPVLSADAIALAAALIWLVHPLLSETIDYTTQRTESLMGLFFLLTLYAAIRAHRAPKKRASAPKNGGSLAWTAVAIASCAAGMATKESMVVAPLVVLLYDVIFEFGSLPDALRARTGLYAGLAATWLELAVIIWHWPRSTVGGTAVSPATYALNQAQMIARYLWLSMWPLALVVDYGVPQPLHLSAVVPQLVFICGLLAATIIALVRWPAFGFLGATFFLTLAPTSSVVPISTEVGAERRMYLPLAALVVLVVVLASRAVRPPRGTVPQGSDSRRNAPKLKSGGYRQAAAIVVLAVVVGALSLRTERRNRNYESELTLWQSVIDVRPQGRARFAFANQLMGAGRHDEAIAQLRLAVADYPDAKAGLGTELLLQGDIKEGIAVLQAFVDANPSLPNRMPARQLLAQGHHALGEQALSQHNPAVAVEEARRSLVFDNSNSDAHNLLGAALASQGNVLEAIPEFQTAIRLNPQNQSATNNLARATAMAVQIPQTPPADRRKAP
ncbi:MAG TPA: tetratricopeptide repeat protein, partial [Vicinamibacterales bacterium]|nr:tetratricopeptide repeat protein [Vicinamibacterales bacterium]